MAIKESTREIFEYIKAHNGEPLTSAEIASALSMNPRSVTGSVNGFVRKHLAEYADGEIELDTGKHKAVKFISLTELGMTQGLDAPAEKDEE